MSSLFSLLSMNVPSQNQCLLSYGRPKGDGEVRLVSNVDKRRQDRWGLRQKPLLQSALVFTFMPCHDVSMLQTYFLFDVAVIVCKRRGDNYEMRKWSTSTISRSPITPLLIRTAERSVRNTVTGMFVGSENCTQTSNGHIFPMIPESAIYHIVPFWRVL